MRREILHDRIGEKSNPIITELLNGRISLEQVPKDQCFIWTGRKTKEARRLRMFRSGRDMAPGFGYCTNRAYGLINVKRETKTVHRLVYEAVFGSLEGSKLTNSCSNTDCVNPHHWHHMNESKTEKGTDDEPIIDPDWTEGEVEQIVDIHLSYHDEIQFDHPDIAQIPTPLLRQVLERRGQWPT